MKKGMKLLGVAMIFVVVKTSAQKSEIVQDTAYMNLVQQRASKIVEKISINDASAKLSVQDKIAWQYYNLNQVYTKRDKALAAFTTDTTGMAAGKQKINAAATRSVDSLHPIFIASLRQDLDAAQIDAVKDGMTYDVLHVTFKAYQDMLPNLTSEQKQQIYTWLAEAREHAMDAESSDKKHAWFGKYKGRINNYLSAQGINMKQATEDWQKRIKQNQ